MNHPNSNEIILPNDIWVFILELIDYDTNIKESRKCCRLFRDYIKLVGGKKLYDNISKCSNKVHTLDLSHTQVKDISALSDCRSLHELDLSDTQVKDTSVLDHIKGLKIYQSVP